MVRGWGYAAALLAVHLCMAAAQSTDTIDAQSVFNQTGAMYNRSDTLLPLHFNQFPITVPGNMSQPDILITLNSTSGGTGLALYCNPQLGQFVGGSYPGPGNAVWTSELSTKINQIFISKNDPYYVYAVNSSAPSIPFVCSVINSDVNTTTNFTLGASIVSDNRTLDMAEQSALSALFADCCSQNGSCNFWKTQNMAASTNANGGDVQTDFCDFPGQICSPTGKLYRLDLGGYNLSCAWPSDTLAAFSELDTMKLGENPGLTANTSTIFATVANLTSLQFLDLHSNTGITGGLENGTAMENVCKAVKGDLASINLNGVGMQGAIPSCLYSSGSRIIALDLGGNKFTGSLADTIPPGSPLQMLALQDNQLTGGLPASLGNATYLVQLNVTNNQFSGTIPAGIGSIVPLQFFYAAMNNLSGPIPDSFGTSLNLQQFDVKLNHLTALPAAWTNASHDAYNSSYVNIRASFNNISGPFPTGLLNAQQLSYLVLNVNNMTGPLPTNNSMFASLRALNVSTNAFTGTIPQQFNQTCLFSSTPLVLITGRPLQQVFDLSYNRLSGALPSFLGSQEVPPWTVDGIFLQGNNLTVDCNNASFNYLTSICPNGNRTTNSTQVALPPTTPRVPPTGVSSGIPSLPVPPTNAVSATNAAPTSESSSKGLSSGAIAGIVVGVLVALAVVAALAFLLLRRRRKDTSMPRDRTGNTFSMPNFGDGEFGRKSSLRKGLNPLNSLNSKGSGFERFDDEPQGTIELSKN